VANLTFAFAMFERVVIVDLDSPFVSEEGFVASQAHGATAYFRTGAGPWRSQPNYYNVTLDSGVTCRFTEPQLGP